VDSARSCRCKRNTINALLAKFPKAETGKILDPNREVHASKLPENAELFGEYLALRTLISTRK
jgi:hypothetical protein